jgi:putrescine aminotransferase
MGAYMLAGLQRASRNHPDIVIDVRGKGLLLALEFGDDQTGFAIAKYLFDRGILVAGTLINARTVRIEPPLTIEQAQADKVFAVLTEALDSLASERIRKSA